jgi:hypothetical protein
VSLLSFASAPTPGRDLRPCPTLLHHRGTRYHRCIVPKCQRHLFHGKVQFRRSLGTLNRDFSAVRSARLEYKARRLFYTLEHSTMDKADRGTHPPVTGQASLQVPSAALEAPVMV